MLVETRAGRSRLIRTSGKKRESTTLIGAERRGASGRRAGSVGVPFDQRPELRRTLDYRLSQQVGDQGRRRGRPARQVLDQERRGERPRAKQRRRPPVERQTRQRSQRPSLGDDDELGAFFGTALGEPFAQQLAGRRASPFARLTVMAGAVQLREPTLEEKILPRLPMPPSLLLATHAPRGSGSVRSVGPDGLDSQMDRGPETQRHRLGERHLHRQDAGVEGTARVLRLDPAQGHRVGHLLDRPAPGAAPGIRPR